jgi:hypothetical protein
MRARFPPPEHLGVKPLDQSSPVRHFPTPYQGETAGQVSHRGSGTSTAHASAAVTPADAPGNGTNRTMVEPWIYSLRQHTNDEDGKKRRAAIETSLSTAWQILAALEIGHAALRGWTAFLRPLQSRRRWRSGPRRNGDRVPVECLKCSPRQGHRPYFWPRHGNTAPPMTTSLLTTSTL